MKNKIFYKFFIIIFTAFLLVQAINIKIDYETTLDYKLGLYADKQEKELSEQYASYMNNQTVNEEEFYNEFHKRFNHEGYCYHILVKDTPFNFINLQQKENITYGDGPKKAKEILIKYDKDMVVLEQHGVDNAQPFITYYNHYTDIYETKIVNDGVYLIDDYNKDEYEIYEYGNNQYTYRHNGPNIEDIIFVDHKEYKDTCNSYLTQLQAEKNYDEILSFYKNYKDGIIFVTKTYVASYDGQRFSRINKEHLKLTDLSNCLTTEHMRYLKGYTDYYVYSFFYMDSLTLMSEINNEINERNMIVYVSVLFASFFVSLFLSWMLTRHIKRISEATTKIANNDFTIHLDEYSTDELGTLSANINTMSQKLNETMTQLNNEINRVTHLEGLRKEFIANFTHEIKTPLGIINGYIELMNQSQDDSKKAFYLNAIIKETSQINTLVMSMLELSRLEAGKIALNIQEVDLEDLISDLLESFFPLFRKKGIKVRVEMNEGMIFADKKEITKVIKNFLSNAITHTPENSLIIITYENRIFTIENEGEQLSEETMKNVFETYVSSNREGTGLGLAICKTILELHGFNYGVKNTCHGVCFWFEG